MVSVTLGVYCLGLATMLLVPWGEVPGRILDDVARVAQHLGAPAVLLVPERVEFVANVLVVVPVVAAASWLRPRVPWSEWTAYGFIASVSVETVQAVFMPERSATFADVVANTAGALIGAALGWLLHQHHEPGRVGGARAGTP